MVHVKWKDYSKDIIVRAEDSYSGKIVSEQEFTDPFILAPDIDSFWGLIYDIGIYVNTVTLKSFLQTRVQCSSKSTDVGASTVRIHNGPSSYTTAAYFQYYIYTDNSYGIYGGYSKYITCLVDKGISSKLSITFDASSVEIKSIDGSNHNVIVSQMYIPATT